MYNFLLLALIFPNITYVDESISERGFVSQTLTKQQILTEFSKTSNTTTPFLKSSNQHFLAFITPWNKDGYRLSIEFGHKITIVVPCWFSILYSEMDGFVITGEDVIDPEWISTMRSNFPDLIISPRLQIPFSPQFFFKNYKAILSKVKPLLQSFSQKYEINSFFFESFPITSPNRNQKTLLSDFIQELRKLCFKKQESIIISNIQIPEYVNQLPEHFSILKSISDFVLLQLYDIRGLPSLSPYSFLEKILNLIASYSEFDRKKVIIGFPAFGFDFSPEGREYVFCPDLLSLANKTNLWCQWHNAYKEHILFYSQDNAQHNVFYPTPLFFQSRIKYVIEKKVGGIGLWELAQTCPFFFDLI